MQDKEAILELRNVSKYFGGITASEDICISVPKGYIYGIIGTEWSPEKQPYLTWLQEFTIRPRVKFFLTEKKINGLPTAAIAKLGVARTFQNIHLFGSLSVYDNILTACQKNITYSLLDGLFRTPKCRRQEKGDVGLLWRAFGAVA